MISFPGKRWRHGLGLAVMGSCVVAMFALLSHGRAEEAHLAASPPASGDEAAFLSENQAAMTKMMNGMDVKPTGDIDRDFVAMMSPHHQGAIDMAIIELRHGKNEALRRIAQEIVVEQMQEINAMKLALGEPAAPSAPAPTQQPPAVGASEHQHMDMHMNMSPGMTH